MKQHYPYLSIVIPAHNEERRIEESVCRLLRQTPGRETEIVIVENGSTDQTWFKCVMLSRHQNVKVARIADRSKALAVAHGMAMARGQFRYMCDADLSTPVEEIYTQFLPAANRCADVVIGSRAVRGCEVCTSPKRWIFSRGFRLVINSVTGLRFRDTQCGFKMFSASAAMQIFPRVKMRSLAFDVEVLWLAQQLGFVIREIPVKWTNDPRSVVRLGPDSWQMLRDVISLPALHREELKGMRRVTS